MLVLLSIIAGIVVIFIASYHLQRFTKEKYDYSIFSLGSMGVSFLGAVALVFACTYYNQNLMLNMMAAIILGVIPYVGMLIRDIKKTSIIVAIIALMLRFTISALFILIIFWYFFMRTDPREKAARNIQ